MNNSNEPKQASQKDKIKRLEKVTDSILDKLYNIEKLVKDQNKFLTDHHIEMMEHFNKTK